MSDTLAELEEPEEVTRATAEDWVAAGEALELAAQTGWDLTELRYSRSEGKIKATLKRRVPGVDELLIAYKDAYASNRAKAILAVVKKALPK